MKRMRPFITAMAAMLLCACGGKAGNAAGQDPAAVAAPSADYVTKTDYDCGSDEDFGISAEIRSGKVFENRFTHLLDHGAFKATEDFQHRFNRHVIMEQSQVGDFHQFLSDSHLSDGSIPN